MACPQCVGMEQEFNSDVARRELRQYRRRGPDRTTRLLIEQIRGRGVAGQTLIDVGGGVGAIQHALLEGGALRVSSVDVSSAYHAAAADEAGLRGWADRIDRVHGDFVAVADQVPTADIVTLDRVLCCYPDVEGLVHASAAHARRLYGVVYPREAWWLRPAFAAANFFLRLRGSSFRIFLHPTEVVEAFLARDGLNRVYHRIVGMWQVALFARRAGQVGAG
jgi:2-polyprenyl-3-methyl-5-hydroxy-6-metoxy-1,4-benzoquinol methylase